MIEKVNPCHPDKVADRIAGASVDLKNSQSGACFNYSEADLKRE